MKKEQICVFLGGMLILCFFACKKGQEASSEDTRPVQSLTQESGQKPGSQLLIMLDGKLDDWSDVEPFWTEAGIAGSGPSESDIDIRTVYFRNDARYLYVFLRIFPTIEERFKISATGDIIGDLFLDTDNQPSTGSEASGLFPDEKFKGYEVRIHIPVGVLRSEGKSTPYAAYEIYTQEGGFYGINVVDRQDTMSEGSLIAQGSEGLEFALRLEAMKLAQPTTVRVLLQEHSHFDEAGGYSSGTLALQPSAK